MNGEHHYALTTNWTGNKGSGTSSYQAYERSYVVTCKHEKQLLGSSDPAFRGDATRYNPEEILLASLSSCHMLWYLHLCSVAGVVVVDYRDDAKGTMAETSDGSGRFTEVILQPVVTVAEKGMADKAIELHVKANEMCFIARSVNFPVKHLPQCRVQEK